MTTPTPSEALADELESVANECRRQIKCVLPGPVAAAFESIADLSTRAAAALRAGPPEGTVPVTALWLRESGRRAQMLFEHDGKWYLACEETMDGPFSHIVEDGGMKRFMPDPLAAASSGGKG